MQLTKYVGPLGRSTIYFVVLKGGSLGTYLAWSLGKPNIGDASIYIIIYIYGTSPFIFGYTMGNSSYKPGLPLRQYIYAAQSNIAYLLGVLFVSCWVLRSSCKPSRTCSSSCQLVCHPLLPSSVHGYLLCRFCRLQFHLGSTPQW